jgi:uncharacterized membrane protein
LTLWLLVFSVHHAAPNAPIWTGQHRSSSHAHHEANAANPASSRAFTAIHDHIHSHCELCFSNSFNLPVQLPAPLRPAENQRITTHLESAEQFDTDIGLPDAHAPPQV